MKVEINNNGDCVNEKGKHCKHNNDTLYCCGCVIFAGKPHIAGDKVCKYE